MLKRRRKRELELHRLLYRLAYGTGMQVQGRVASPTEKAEELLKSHLTAFQRYTYEKYRFFYVKGSDGTIYGLCDGVWVIPIHMDDCPPLMRGIHAKNVNVLPHGDRLLGQKLLLETSAHWVNSVACTSGATPEIERRIYPKRVLQVLRGEQGRQSCLYQEAFSFFAGYAGPTPHSDHHGYGYRAIYYYDEQGRQCLG